MCRSLLTGEAIDVMCGNLNSAYAIDELLTWRKSSLSINERSDVGRHHERLSKDVGAATN